MPDTGLPPILAEIAEGAGLPAALALGRERASRRIYIPRTVDGAGWLVDIVGIAAARWMCEQYGGDYLVIPSALAGEARRRREAIARLSDEGASVDRIASAIGIDRRTVQRTRRRHRTPTKLPLFDR